MAKKKIERICLTCQNRFWIYPNVLRHRVRKYCSIKCSGASRKGVLLSEEHKRKIGATMKTKPSNRKGKKWSEESRARFRGSRITRTPEQLLARKRFHNQRYKANKRNAWGTHTFEEWELFKMFYGFSCLACGRKEPEVKLTEDHIVPLSMGGSDFIVNIQPLCVACNTRKHAKEIDYRNSGNLLQILN